MNSKQHPFAERARAVARRIMSGEHHRVEVPELIGEDFVRFIQMVDVAICEDDTEECEHFVRIFHEAAGIEHVLAQGWAHAVITNGVSTVAVAISTESCAEVIDELEKVVDLLAKAGR